MTTAACDLLSTGAFGLVQQIVETKQTGHLYFIIAILGDNVQLWLIPVIHIRPTLILRSVTVFIVGLMFLAVLLCLS